MKLKYVHPGWDPDEEYTEERRIRSWHATFNAALTGLLAGWAGITTTEAVLTARSTADFVHGSIEK